MVSNSPCPAYLQNQRLRSLWLVAGLLLATAARAQDIDPEVRRVALETAASGDVLFAQGDYVAALGQFTRAAELVSAPTLLLRQGECLEKMGRLIEAAEAYRKAADFAVQDNTTEPFRLAVATAKVRLTTINARIAHLELIVQADQPESVRVTMNERPVSAPQRQTAMALNPGQYRVKAVAGSRMAIADVILEEGSQKQVTLRLFRAPAPDLTPNFVPAPVPRLPSSDTRRRSSHQDTVGWVAVGVGAAGILTGVATGVEVLHLKQELDQHGCVNSVCGPGQRQDVHTYNSLRVASTAGFIVGGVGLVVGVALVHFMPRSQQASRKRLIPWLGIGSAGVAGAF